MRLRWSEPAPRAAILDLDVPAAVALSRTARAAQRPQGRPPRAVPGTAPLRVRPAGGATAGGRERADVHLRRGNGRAARPRTRIGPRRGGPGLRPRRRRALARDGRDRARAAPVLRVGRRRRPRAGRPQPPGLVAHRARGRAPALRDLGAARSADVPRRGRERSRRAERGLARRAGARGAVDLPGQAETCCGCGSTSKAAMGSRPGARGRAGPGRRRHSAAGRDRPRGRGRVARAACVVERARGGAGRGRGPALRMLRPRAAHDAQHRSHRRRRDRLRSRLHPGRLHPIGDGFGVDLAAPGRAPRLGVLRRAAARRRPHAGRDRVRGRHHHRGLRRQQHGRHRVRARSRVLGVLPR